MARVLVINPNSSSSVTRAIDEAMNPLRREAGPDVEVIGLSEGPAGIQSQVDIERVVPPLLTAIRAQAADAYVIACFSDPGLHAAREIVSPGVRVWGIAESAVLAAMSRGARFGVISILPNSIPRHMRYFGAMGVMDRLAGDRSIGVGVAQITDENHTYARMRDVGGVLRDQDGADVLIMGCAGMARYRDRLEKDLGIAVVEPTQAAVAQAVGSLSLGW